MEESLKIAFFGLETSLVCLGASPDMGFKAIMLDILALKRGARFVDAPYIYHIPLCTIAVCHHAISAILNDHDTQRVFF